MKRCVVAIVILAQFIITNVIAQTGIPSEGREYYIGILYPAMQYQTSTYSGWKPLYNTYLILTPAADAVITITYFDASGTETASNSLKLSAKKETLYTLDNSKFQTSDRSGEIGLYSTCHIMCTAPVSVQFVSTGSCSGGSYLALPTQCYGEHYVVQSYNDNAGGIGGFLNTTSSRGCFQILAAHDGTTVEITPSTTTFKGHPGAVSGTGSTGTPEPFSVALNRGEIYTVFSEGKDGGSDLTGTVIDANQPIGVLAGHENASTIGSAQPSGTEGRDYMVEQLIPVECWDSTGYFTIPFITPSGTAGAGSGLGDEVRAVTEPNNGNSVVYLNGSSTIVVPPFKYSPYAQYNVNNPTSFFDQNGEPIGVMMYDQRMQLTNDPFLAPSMVSIIPRSRWKSEYYFSVPDLKYDTYDRYLYIICSKADFNNGKVLMGSNGVAPSSINSSVLIKKQYTGIPGDSTLMGISGQVTNTNSFYIIDEAVSSSDPTRHSTLAAYYNATFSKKRNVGSGFNTKAVNDYSEYGNPLGMNFGQFGTVKPKISTSVVNQCGKWVVTASDSGDANTGIRYIEIVNYQKGSYVAQITPSVNVRFDPTLDSVNKGEIVLPGTDKEYTFTVEPANPADSAIATIEIYDNSGASLLVNLSKSVSTTTSSSGSLTQKSGALFSYSSTPVGSSSCGAVIITNPQVTGAGDFSVNHISLGKDTSFKFQTTYADSLKIKPGSFLSIGVCYTPHDTALAIDTIFVSGDCGNQFEYILQGKGVSGLIQASDYNFPETNQGDKNCIGGYVTNTGSLPFTLEKSPVISDPTNFFIDPTFLSSLPITVNPGDTVRTNVCFNPQDENSHSATLTWITDIPESLNKRMKPVVALNGKGLHNGIGWTPTPVTIVIDTPVIATPENTQRVYLLNPESTNRLVVHSITITGADSADFSISNNQYGLTFPLASPFTLNTNDSAWFDILFKPDTSDGYTTRNATLTATYNLEGSTSNLAAVTPLVGSFISDAGVSSGAASQAMEAFLYGGRLVVYPPSDQHGIFDCSIYDLLGRKIAAETNMVLPEGASAVDLSVGNIPNGIYFVYITSDGRTWTCKVMNGE